LDLHRLRLFIASPIIWAWLTLSVGLSLATGAALIEWVATAILVRPLVILLALTAIVGLLLAPELKAYLMPEIDVGGHHLGPQRDVVAFVLESHGLDEEARQVRRATGNLTYWGIADELTANWQAKHAAAPSLLRKGAEALVSLCEYAAMAGLSHSLIRQNAALLFELAGEPALSAKALGEPSVGAPHAVLLSRDKLRSRPTGARSAKLARH
jgi:hypothetical protein